MQSIIAIAEAQRSFVSHSMGFGLGLLERSITRGLGAFHDREQQVTPSYRIASYASSACANDGLINCRKRLHHPVLCSHKNA